MSTSPGPSASISTPTVVITDRLQSAAAQGHLDVLRKLVESGATLHPDKEGRTALHFAALNGHVDVCEFLVEHGCETNVQDAVGYSALHRAASHGNQKIMELLLKKGCAMDTQDENGNAAIHEAAWNGFSQTLDLLIKYNCNIQISNKAGFTALHLSAQNGHNQSTRVLLLAGCNSDLKNNYGDTALHTAARYGHAGVTRILISARCSLNEQNKNGDTALHIAAALKRRKIAKLLVDAGIDVYIKNKQNETAIEVACRKEHQEIIDIINSFSRPKTPKNANPKVVNFKDVPVDIIEGPMVVPDETTAKPEKQERKFFDFFKKKKKDKDKDVTDKAQMLGQVRSPDPAVQGFFSQYIPRPGIQYYRDLAGNIKQGPIGYTPICQCMPTLKKLEHTVHTNKESLYDHIEASNRALCHRMDQLDKRTMDQVGSIDHLTKERLAEEERNCQNRIEQRMEEEREYLRANYQQNMQLGVEDWLEAKLSTYGHCLDHHHDDTALPNNNIFTDIHHTENGRLFKSRSDETLSQSDNHSGKFRKKEFYESRQAAMQQIRAWQVPNYKQERSHSRDVNDNVKSANYRQTSQLPPQPYRGQNSYNQNLHTSHRNIDRNDFTAHSQMSNRNEPVRRNNENFSSKQDILSPSTNSTVKSPHSQQANDSNYGHYGHQGAIPKRLPTSQTWHNTEQWRREASPATQNATKVLDQNSHKSSPHGQVISKGMVRSRTENEGFIRKLNQRDVPQREQFQRHAAPRQSAPERCLSNTQESGKGRTGAQMFNKNNDARQSFQERGSSNTNTGTNSANMTSSVVPGAGLGPQESNSRPSSGKSEDKSDCHYNTKPTFTTFGYEEKKLPDNVLQNTNSPNNTISVQPGSSVEKETPYIYPIKRSKTPNNELEKSTPHDGQSLYGYFISKGEQSKFTPGQHSRAVSQPRNQDNAYMTMSSKPMLRQRTRSSDGILDDTLTSAHDLVKRSASKERNFNTTHQISQRPRSQTSQTPKSLSENHSPLQNTPGDNVNHSAVYRNNSNNPNTLHSGYPVVPKKPSIQIPNTQQYSNNDSQNKNTPVANSSNNVYVQMKTPVTNDTRYHMHGLVQELQLRSKDGGQGLRENPYSSVRNVSQYTADVQYSKQGQTHHSSYNVNYVGQSERPQYCESSPIVKSFSKSEPNLDRSLNDSNDHDPGYTSPVSPRGDYSTCQIPTGEFSANKDNRKIVANYPNAYNKEDSSSNPDSGYSSKIFGSRSHQSNVPSNSGTPSSSFCTDHDNSMSVPSNNNSPHPQISHSDYELIKNVQNSAQKTAQNQNLQSHVNSWYQQKLQQAAQRLRDGPYTSNQGDSPPCQPKHNQYQYSQTSDLYNNQSQYATSNYPSNKDYVTNNYQRIFIRGSDV